MKFPHKLKLIFLSQLICNIDETFLITEKSNKLQTILSNRETEIFKKKKCAAKNNLRVLLSLPKLNVAEIFTTRHRYNRVLPTNLTLLNIQI